MYKKVIIILIFIIALLLIGIGYFALSPNDNSVPVNNTTTSEVNVTKIDNTTETTSVSSSSGQYGYCAICGRALSYSEANNEYTQGKVCLDCAKNPYYYTDEGSQYANGKLEEAYPESYNGINNSN